MKMVKERIDHRKAKGSTLFWFVMGLIPFVSLYLYWKVSELISGHEKRIERYEFLDHRGTKGPTVEWFVLFLVPYVLLIPLSTAYYAAGGTLSGGVMVFAAISFTVGILIFLYLQWKMAELVSGHEKIYIEKHETIAHMERKDSTTKWFVLGIIPIANLYLLWRVAEAVSGHEKIFVKSKP